MQDPFNILVVDDEKNICRTLAMILEGEGYGVSTAGSAEDGLKLLADSDSAIDMVLLDIRLPKMDGLEALKHIKKDFPDLPVVMISGHASIQDAVQATQLGAYDFFEKPLNRELVLLAVRNCLDKLRLERKMHHLIYESEQRFEMIGKSLCMQELFDIIAKVAPSQGRVLITGESGTGKELVARAIHRNSTRKDGPFVKVNCAAIPSELIESELFGYEKGAFSGATKKKMGQVELAHQGTLFLDEIADMSLSAQAKVLRVLQTSEITRVGGESSHRVDIRLIAATNKNLQDEITKDNFREDLYFRLNVVPINTPPLRQHLEDIPVMAEEFVKFFCRENGYKIKQMDDIVLNKLRQCTWPGNVRELKNVIERMVILSGESIGPEDLPADLNRKSIPGLQRLGGTLTLRELREEVEKGYIQDKLEENKWNIKQTAEVLGIERTNLHKKINTYSLKRGNNL